MALILAGPSIVLTYNVTKFAKLRSPQVPDWFLRLCDHGTWSLTNITILSQYLTDVFSRYTAFSDDLESSSLVLGLVSACQSEA